MINQEQIAFQVFDAIEEEKFLPIGEQIGLEYLSTDMDGVFKTPRAWKTFVNGNFLSDYSKEYWRDSVKDSTIKKYCYSPEEYKHLFVVKVGQDKYIRIAPEEIELEYEYELFYNRESDFPCSVEIFVKAKIK